MRFFRLYSENPKLFLDEYNLYLENVLSLMHCYIIGCVKAILLYVTEVLVYFINQTFEAGV